MPPHRAFSPSQPKRRLLAAALIALAAGASLLTIAAGRERGPAIVPGSSEAGNYLAARYAASRHDFRAAADLLLAAMKKAPDDVRVARQTLYALLLDGRLAVASKIARRLVEAGERAPYAHLTLAVEAIRGGRFAAAEKEIEAIPENSVNRILRPLLRAWVRFGDKRSEAAVKALEPLSASRRTLVLYNLHAALIEDALGRNKAAERHYRAVLDAQRQRSGERPSLRTVQLAGAFFERTGKADEAAALYREYAKDHPDSRLFAAALARLKQGTPPKREIASAAAGAAEAFYGLASALSRQNLHQAGLVLTRYGLALRPDFPVLQILTAQLLESLDNFAAANALYRTVRPSSPLHWTARLAMARNLDRIGKLEEAEVTLREMSRERPDDPEPLIQLGDVFRSHERFREAVDAYDAAFARIPKLEPRHWSLLYARGIALERAKMWERAEADFLKALEFKPEQPLVLNYLGYSWVEQGRNLEHALDMIRKAVELRPSDGYIVDSLGWAYYHLGDYDSALEELQRAVSLRPEDPVINDHLGDAYWMVGRHREARFQWRQALELGPEPEVRKRIEDKLAKGLSEDISAGDGD